MPQRRDQRRRGRARSRPTRIVISPGPGTPGRGRHLARADPARSRASVPILGVCLGHQRIGQAFGGEVVRAPRLMHGKTSHDPPRRPGVFAACRDPFAATRYHSLVVERGLLARRRSRSRPGRTTATIMGLRHRELPVEGVQFHPESHPHRGRARRCCAISCERCGLMEPAADHRARSIEREQRPRREARGAARRWAHHGRRGDAGADRRACSSRCA